MTKIRAVALTAAALATTIVLAGCSGSSSGMSGMPGMGAPAASSSPSATASFNAADVAFAQTMIPHHQSAIDMADVILAKEGVDQRVLDLANQIKAAQAPEITQLTTWLSDWGADPSMGGMNMTTDMSALKAATGVEATRMFLTQMKVHHQGAITTAQTEIDTGANPDAIAMARNIVSSQTQEIWKIDSILASL